MLKYPELFTPFKIGKLELMNRIVMSPMMVGGWLDANGNITDEVIDYYEERAKGGTGLIYTGAFPLNANIEKANAIFVSPFDQPEAFMAQLKKVVDRVHLYNTKIFIQMTVGNGRLMPPFLLSGTPVSPSENPNWWDPNTTCRALTKEEIERLVQSAVMAALNCMMTGCDGVDFIGIYGGYMGDQFGTAAFNRRTDEYGGSIEGRAKLFTDIVKGVKAVCGADFPVTARLAAKHYMKGIQQSAVPGEKFQEFGRDIEDSIAIARELEKAGFDALLMACGAYDSMYWLYSPMYQKDGLWLEDVAKVKAQLKIPVICPGKITRPQLANEAIKNNMVDAVALGRALLADAHWVNKARMGRDDAIRPCISCNNGCIGHDFAGLPMTCAVNPDLFNEKYAGLQKVAIPKEIAIIGAGVAGMEAARIAALRGHNVTIYDKSNSLGGVVVAGSVPQSKDADRRLVKWYEKELKDAGVKLKFGSEMTLDRIAKLDADEIVVATGATAKVPPIPGVDQPHVCTATDLLLGKKEAGKRVTVIGGGQVGCELALWLEEKGKQVTLIEALGGLMTLGKEALFIANKKMLEDMLTYKNIRVMLGTQVAAIGKDSVDVVAGDKKETIAADTVVLAVGYNSDDRLYREISAGIPKKVWLLGDARAPGNIMFAIRDGATIGRVL
ncbi:MAG: FAD-dependent oxidoreductase [Dehalococcoidia bacterium]